MKLTQAPPNKLLSAALLIFLLSLQAASAFYDPGLQRWVNRDPIGQAGGVNLYVFAGNNSMFLTDLFGLNPFQLFDDLDTAAKDAACYFKAHPNKSKSTGSQYEQASALFVDTNLKYYYNDPKLNAGSTFGYSEPDYDIKMARTDKLAGIVHDHVAGEDFSDKNDDPKGLPKDKELYKSKDVPGYVLTPKGDVKKYDQKTGKTIPKGSCK